MAIVATSTAVPFVAPAPGTPEGGDLVETLAPMVPIANVRVEQTLTAPLPVGRSKGYRARHRGRA